MPGVGGWNSAWTAVAGHKAMLMGSVRSSSETDRVGVRHFNHARGVQYWHSTRSGAADREEQGDRVQRHIIALCWRGFIFLQK